MLCVHFISYICMRHADQLIFFFFLDCAYVIYEEIMRAYASLRFIADYFPRYEKTRGSTSVYAMMFNKQVKSTRIY